MRNVTDGCSCRPCKSKDVLQLFLRLVLAYGFLKPALLKINDIEGTAAWFAGLHIPFPTVNAYLSVGTEILGVVLLTAGLFVRAISIPLIVVMVVAIVTVHWENGFEAGNNGFEIPLYYILMLGSLVLYGAGRFSAGHLLFRTRYSCRLSRDSGRAAEKDNG